MVSGFEKIRICSPFRFWSWNRADYYLDHWYQAYPGDHSISTDIGEAGAMMNRINIPQNAQNSQNDKMTNFEDLLKEKYGERETPKRDNYENKVLSFRILEI